MNEEVWKLSQHRLQRAERALEEGRSLLAKGFFEGAVNRFYYAAFYAAKALLATKDLDSSKHSGMISLFHEHFVKTNLFDKEKAKALSRSFEERQDTDYEDFVSITEQEVEDLQRQVEAFLKECQKVLASLPKREK